MSEKINTAVNGFGRIGTLYTRIALDKFKSDLKIAAISGTDPQDIADRLAFDSTHRHFEGHTVRPAEFGENAIFVDDVPIPLNPHRKPEESRWNEMADGLVVVEATGVFTSSEEAGRHIKGGAQSVIITAPAQDTETTTIVRGVNDTESVIESAGDIIAVSSCSTNCIAPIVKVLSDGFDVRWASADIIHAYTNSQRILDGSGSSSSSRRSFDNVIPASTGSSKEIRRMFPDIPFHSNSFRVPIQDGSLAIIKAEIQGTISTDDVIEQFERAAKGKLQGIVELTEESMTSGRVIGKGASAVLDKTHIISRQVNSHTIIELQAWFDNEWGYANRVAEVTKLIGQRAVG